MDYINETYHDTQRDNIDPHDNDSIFKVMGSEVKVTETIFQNCTFPAKMYDRRFSVDDRLVFFCKFL